mmetsp:Transcript_7602/g.14958  ORF Transcript_7602/g.14958 Transcript_7602/m.14958 type:complete len:242 (-) Transcript_7602:90-815(-)
MWQFLTALGMSGWRAPWSSTRPLTRRESLSALCCMCMISIMNMSMGMSAALLCTHRMASTHTSPTWSASSSWSLVRSAVRDTQLSISRSILPSLPCWCLKFSRNLVDSVLAMSKPSQIRRGCTPSPRCRSACFRSSPMKMTVDVVPSPQISSWAVAVRAMRAAVGFWICISWSSVLPSLVSLTSPDPDTSIFSVPLGPRLLLRTSCRPLAALMFMASATKRLACSASWLRSLRELIVCLLC